MYRIVLIDSLSNEICDRPADTLKEAKEKAKWMLSAAYEELMEVSHDTLGTAGVLIFNADDECVFDKLR